MITKAKIHLSNPDFSNAFFTDLSIEVQEGGGVLKGDLVHFPTKGGDQENRKYFMTCHIITNVPSKNLAGKRQSFSFSS